MSTAMQIQKTALFLEAIKAYIRVQAAKRLAVLGGTDPQMPDVPRRR